MSNPHPDRGEPRQVPLHVRPPMFISSRLMAALTIPGAGTLHLITDGYDHQDGERRIRYRWLIEDTGGHELDAGNDLFSGAGASPDYLAAAESLLAFLEHTAETTHRHGADDGALFTTAAAEWARQHSDELAMARLEIDPNPGNHPGNCVPCAEGIAAPHLPRIT